MLVDVTSLERWKPIKPPLDFEPRTRDYLSRVLDSLCVASNPRYARTNLHTFCNVFAWDFTRCMGVEIPHWIDQVTQLPCNIGRGSGQWTRWCREMVANEIPAWLDSVGHNLSHWTEVGPAGAQAEANVGHPTVAVWQAPVGKVGHVAVVTPHDGSPVGPWICNVGARNFREGPLAKGFGSYTPRYWSAP